MAILSDLKVNNTSYDINAKTLDKLTSDKFVKAFSKDCIASINGNGNSRYAKIATLQVTGTYKDYPIVFELYGRAISHTFMTVQFKNNSGTDPDIDKFITTDYTAIYIKKTATSTWELYVDMMNNWNIVYIRQCFSPIVNNGVNITFNMELISALPTDCIQVVNGVVANTVNSITNLGRLTSANLPTVGDKKVTVFQSSSSMTTAKPMADGYIMNFNWDNNGSWGSQLFIPDSKTNSLQYRKQNGTTWSTQSWITVLDSDNTKLANGGNIIINNNSQMLGVDITPYLSAGKVMPFSAVYRYGNYPVEIRMPEDDEHSLYIGVERDSEDADIMAVVYEFYEQSNGWKFVKAHDNRTNNPDSINSLFSIKKSIILTMGSEDNPDSYENFKSFATSSNLELINKAIDEKNPFILVRGYDTDGYFLSHATINVDGSDMFVRVYGSPYRYDDDYNKNVIAVDYYIDNNSWSGYELITASVGNRISL